MAKERDWVDYVNLGSNLYQNFQLSGVQNNLGMIASAAASERARAEQEDRLRETVFQADTNLKGLRVHIDNERTAVLALATFTLAKFEQHDVTSASFRTFEDKERLRSVLEGFKALVKECESGLSAGEKAEAQLCARYFREQGALDLLIQRQTEKEQQDSERSKLQALRSKALLAWIPVIVGRLLVITGVTLIIVGFSAPHEPHAGQLGLGVLGLFAGMVLWVAGVNSKSFIEAKKARTSLRQLEQNASVLDANLRSLAELTNTLGATSASKLQKVQDERDALMGKVLKDGDKRAEARSRMRYMEEKAAELKQKQAVAEDVEAKLNKRRGHRGGLFLLGFLCIVLLVITILPYEKYWKEHLLDIVCSAAIFGGSAAVCLVAGFRTSKDRLLIKELVSLQFEINSLESLLAADKRSLRG